MRRMPSRSVLIVIAALVVVTWVLISSINTIQVPVQNSSSNGNTGNQGKTGQPNNNGQGNSNGTGKSRSLLIGNFTLPKLALPNLHLNLSFLNFLYKFLTAIYHLLSPVLKLIQYFLEFIAYLAEFLVRFLLDLFSFFHFNQHLFNSTRSLTNNYRSGSGGPNGVTSSNAYELPQYITYVVIGLMVALVAITSTAVLSRRKGKDSNSESEIPENILPPSGGTESREEYVFRPPDVKSEPFHGWSTGNDLIKPEIPPDLPLIYPLGVPLSVHMKNVAELRGDFEVLENEGNLQYTISLPKGCTEASATSGIEKDRKIFRGVDIRNEVSLLLRINIASGIKTESRFRTVRELLYSEEVRNIIVDDRKLHDLVRSYERAYYGMKETELSEFQKFLYSLRDTFADARIAMCGS